MQFLNLHRSHKSLSLLPRSFLESGPCEFLERVSGNIEELLHLHKYAWLPTLQLINGDNGCKARDGWRVKKVRWQNKEEEFSLFQYSQLQTKTGKHLAAILFILIAVEGFDSAIRCVNVGLLLYRVNEPGQPATVFYPFLHFVLQFA